MEAKFRMFQFLWQSNPAVNYFISYLTKTLITHLFIGDYRFQDFNKSVYNFDGNLMTVHPRVIKGASFRKKLKFFLTFELKMKRHIECHLKYNNILN